EHYLPYILRSKVKLLLQGNEDQQDLLDFVDNSMKVEEQKVFLEARYSEELALLYLFQEDYARARHYTSIVFKTFLQDWGSIDTLMTTTRIGKLQILQKLTEMQEFLDFVSNEDTFQDSQAALSLVTRWQTRSPDPIVEPCNIWDDIVTNRCLYVDQLCHKLSSVQEEFEEEDKFREKRLQFILAQAESAVEQHNFPVAKKKLKIIESEVKSLSESPVLIQFYHCYAKLHNKITEVTMDASATLSPVLGALGLLERKRDHKLLKESSVLTRRHLVLQGNIFDSVTSSLLSLPDLSSVSPKDVQKLVEAAGCSMQNADMQEIINGLVDRGYQYIKEAVDIYEEDSSNDKSTVETHMALAKYCDKYLKLREEDDSLTGESIDSYPEAVVTSLLRCIELDHMDARQRFPRLLQLVEYYPDTMQGFINKVSVIPCWMFMTWIGQLVALLDKPEAPAVHNILIRMAREYPQALVYPFKVSKECYTFERSSEGKENLAVVERLDFSLSKIPLVETFINALEQFGQPNALFKDWIGEMAKLLHVKQRNADAVQRCYTQMYSSLMMTQRQAGGVSQDLYDTEPDSVEIGQYRQKFAKAYYKDLDSAFGKDGKKIMTMSEESFIKAADGIFKKMDLASKGTKGHPNLVPSEKLGDYSKWMSGLAAQDMDLSLEIPGQYTGLSKPMPEYHVKIAGFDSRVLVLSSMRKPKRITINGTDMKDHKFLVKGGEDLRQDQRLEQLFYIMNRVFSQDPDCKPRQYKLRTYQVIPMTTRVGLIEWVNQTKTLKEVVYGTMTEQEKAQQKAMILQRSFLSRYGDLSDPKTYWGMYEKCSRTEAVKSCQDKENSLPWDLLRRAYLQMSTSPETFYTLRRHFAISHALLCICHYILGIGDRHLSNFMVDLETGGMIGIDFGHAFGSATQFLPVPELMPIRLTRQILNVMMPLREKGLIESTMVHALRALRANYDLLLNTMDVFVKDLSVDWLALAERQLQATPSSQEDKEDAKWYPKQKVAFAKRKLKGANPWCITRDELELGHKKRGKTYQAFIAITQGQDNTRTKFAEMDLTPEQQVACLIDQATDPNILGRAYAGWEPWV
ncbi:DNA-dependent protein kinase catalytic subunit-like, partial [Lingula anatina]|uniref:DNA-dependent protein kinase catalytic subunit n=1 Tax=Lingula anatina TaxID=7574 RepID=A0A1S3IBL4_LINAN